MYRKYADEAMDFVKTIEADGARLPGSDEEKAACKKIVDEISERAGLKSKTESFTFAPEASIGAINKLGWVAMLFLVLYYIGAPILAMLGYIGILVFVFTQIVRYTGVWDFCFKKERAENIITELEPASGKTDYTVYLGAHYDSSWCWKLAAINPKTAIIKTAYGIVGTVAMIVMSLLSVLNGFGVLSDPSTASIVLYVLPVATIPGFFFVSHFLTQDKTVASPGAMDNLSGIGLNMMVLKYFKDHPEEMPEGMKLVNICFAAEEAGLKGSFAYVNRHKDEFDKDNMYVLNVDSISDPGYFAAVKGDPWQGTKFDRGLIDMIKESIGETGEKINEIVNPVGGCDSTPFCRAGVRTVTLAAQVPTISDYYHTYNDTTERLDEETFEKGFIVILNTIKKIAASRGAAPKAAAASAEKTESAVEATEAEAPAAEPAAETSPEQE